MSEDTGKILVVDDNEMNRDMLSRRLTRRGYDLDVAEDGQVALDKIEAHAYDLVLLDIMMPGIDGMQVLEKVRETRSPSDLPIIMATAKSETEDIVRALKLGANDYVTKPIDFPVALARVRTQLSLKSARDELVAAHTTMREELEAASKVQRDLLPQSAPEIAGLGFAWRYAPCDALGGDILNIIPLDERRVAVYVLDVCGHGVRASLLSVAMTHTLSRKSDPSAIITRPAGGGYEAADPDAVARRLGELFPGEANDMFFATLAFGIIDAESREFRFTCAGHPGPLVVRADGSTERMDVPGVPIGVDMGDLAPDISYTTRTTQLGEGDRVYIYSDGLLEEQDADRQEFGEERFAGTLSDARAEPLDTSLEKLIAAIRAFSGRDSFVDDLSILGIEVR